jgi:hypothetical protein
VQDVFRQVVLEFDLVRKELWEGFLLESWICHFLLGMLAKSCQFERSLVVFGIGAAVVLGRQERWQDIPEPDD